MALCHGFLTLKQISLSLLAYNTILQFQIGTLASLHFGFSHLELANVIIWPHLKKEAIPIGFFAIIGVVLTIIIIGIAVNGVFQIPFINALLFGAILVATDHVAVDVIFKKFPIPHKLNMDDVNNL